MINNVVLVGRMTRDAELRYTPQNQAVATLLWLLIATLKIKVVSVKRILSIVSSGASRQKILLIGLRKAL